MVLSKIPLAMSSGTMDDFPRKPERGPNDSHRFNRADPAPERDAVVFEEWCTLVGYNPETHTYVE